MSVRRLEKLEAPSVLAENCEAWTAEYEADKGNLSKRYRYRHPEIKAQLRHETGSKCVYCESKIGHNTPGDVEHKTPTSVSSGLHFCWENLTIACAECNRRKNDYYDEQKPFLDPYIDDVEVRVVHHGPVAGWKAGDETAEISVRTLEMHDRSRIELINRKIETIVELNELLARRASITNPFLSALLSERLMQMQDTTAEYSAMVRTVCSAAG